MNITLIITMLTGYALGVVIMLLIPEEWMPKAYSSGREATKGFYRKVFVIVGGIVTAMVLLIAYFVA